MGHTRINPNPLMTQYLVESFDIFKDAPMIICDIGARGGLEKHWNVFGSQAIFIGFEPDAEACDLINRTYQVSASSELYQFHPVALGKQKGQQSFSICRYPEGSSFYPANLEFVERFSPEHVHDLNVTKTLNIETISLDEFAETQSISSIDFIKLDVEGSELDILQGAINMLQNSVLGLSIEVLFHDTMRHQPTFSEIDRFLQGLGFQLFDLEIYRYARRTLPLPLGPLGNTSIGQVLWGQALYLLDGFSEIKKQSTPNNSQWDQTRILKLACLMEIFWLPDCAMELIQLCPEKCDPEIELLLEKLKLGTGSVEWVH